MAGGVVRRTDRPAGGRRRRQRRGDRRPGRGGLLDDLVRGARASRTACSPWWAGRACTTCRRCCAVRPLRGQRQRAEAHRGSAWRADGGHPLRLGGRERVGADRSRSHRHPPRHDVQPLLPGQGGGLPSRAGLPERRAGRRRLRACRRMLALAAVGQTALQAARRRPILACARHGNESSKPASSALCKSLRVGRDAVRSKQKAACLALGFERIKARLGYAGRAQPGWPGEHA